MSEAEKQRGGRCIDAIGLIGAYAVSAVLGFAAFAKLSQPDTKKLVFGDVPLDYLVAGVEVLVILVLLPFHRWRHAWAAVGVMFGGFGGYAAYWTFSKGQPCGCFGDLWHPPLGLTVAMDGLLMLAGLGLAWRFGLGKKLLIAAAVGAIVAGGIGWQYAYSNSPEKFEADLKEQAQNAPQDGGEGAEQTPAPTDAQGVLWYSDLLAEQRDLHETGEVVATVVFVYEVGCSTCEMYLPDMEYYSATLGDYRELVRVVLISKTEAKQEAGIELWAWESSPVVFVARDGEVLDEQFRYSGEDVPFDIVGQVYEWASDGVPMPY